MASRTTSRWWLQDNRLLRRIKAIIEEAFQERECDITRSSTLEGFDEDGLGRCVAICG